MLTTITQTSGAFLTLAIGVTIAFVVLILELAWKNTKHVISKYRDYAKHYNIKH